jgi:hypothetical protein
MPVIDITPHILGRRNRKNEIVTWLVDHVGESIGRGMYPVGEVGVGWHIITTEEPCEDSAMAVGWAVDISSPEKATHFALAWVK